MKHLILVSHRATTEAEGRILRLAGWMGVSTKAITVDNDGNPAAKILDSSADGNCCVVVSIQALELMRKASGSAWIEQLMENSCSQLLVYACSDSVHDDILPWLTEGRVRRLVSAKRRHLFHLPDSGRQLSKQFAGLSFQAHQGIQLPSFELSGGRATDIQEIMLADGCPVYLRTIRGSCEIFLFASSDMPDIGQPLSQDQRIEEYYDQLIPLLLFLRHCFGEMCWHAPATTARFIIDDPLLTESYGFLNYRALLRSMSIAKYGTSIAFIPWNHWRTSRRRAPKLFGRGVNLSICVHGCDHTNKEFDGVEQNALQRKAGIALRRMERHEKRTGIPFERVMVFPQGRFSSFAISALRSHDYLAAINTTCFPTNDGAHTLTIADFLRPAVVRFNGFPVFQRRYPRRVIDCAFDMFVGRPVFLVEHHQYFRGGYANPEEFVKSLHSIEPALSWGTLSSQLVRCCAMRKVAEKRTAVQFFTRKFQFQSDGEGRTSFVFEKYEPDPSMIAAVLINGVSAPFSFRDDFLCFELELDPGHLTEVLVVDRPTPSAATANRLGLRYTLGVSVRRLLSELRDNTLTRHPRLLAAATGIAKTLRATGEDDREGISQETWGRQ